MAAEVTPSGESRWQYSLDDRSTWRTFGDKHGRALTQAHEQRQTSLQVLLRGREYIAKWDRDSVLQAVASKKFARLASLDLVVEIVTTGPLSELSAGERLNQRRREIKDGAAAVRAGDHAAASAEHAEVRRRAALALAGEDAATKAARAAMSAVNRAGPGDKKEGPGDKRSRRIKFGARYAAGVAAWRARNRADNAVIAVPAAPGDAGASALEALVVVRARPLFEYEAQRGEWDSVSLLPRGGIAVHEGVERVVRSANRAKGGGALRNSNVLRHHAFGAVRAVVTDDELYAAVRHLPRRAVAGHHATLFCYGMTGSGKTYSMDAVHRRLPADLFALLARAAAATTASPVVRFSAFELVGKRCFELVCCSFLLFASFFCLLIYSFVCSSILWSCAASEQLPSDPALWSLLPAEIEEGALPAEAGAAAGDGGGGAAAKAGKREVFLRVDAQGTTHAHGVAVHDAADPGALAELLRAAVLRRETAATGNNATSSRSHAVYALSVPGAGELTLIDLAGSEGNQETRFHSAKAVAEAKEINNSLAVLRQCLRARSKTGVRAPYRESVLTRALKPALTDGGAVTALLACVSPACTHLEHSLRTLRTAMYLSGEAGGAQRGDDAAPVEEDILSAPEVVRGGPKTWGTSALAAWVAERPFGARIALPLTMTGKAVMKLPKVRLKQICDGDADVAAQLFAALRVASKEASQREREMRRAIMGRDPGNVRGGAMGFGRSAPSNPVVAAAPPAARR
jgi:hypothetical protein